MIRRTLNLETQELTRLLAENERKNSPLEFTDRQRLILRDGTHVSAEAILTSCAQDLTLRWMLDHGVRPCNILAAGLSPQQLWRMGVSEPHDLRQLRLDALDLVSVPDLWLSQALTMWGDLKLKEAFCITPADAVAFAGTPAARALVLTTAQLLQRCENSPLEAESVLAQQGAHPLDGCPVATLVKTGIKREGLARAGIDFLELVQSAHPTAAEIDQLGFSGLVGSNPGRARSPLARHMSVGAGW